MKLPIFRTNTPRLPLMRMALIAGFSLAISAKATVPDTDLPDFDNLPNFSLLGNQLNAIDTTINGNAGVSENGLLNLEAPSTINGDVSIGNGATLTGPGQITGNIFASQDLTTEQNTVFTASEVLDALPADLVISGNQTAALSFAPPAGEVEVVDLNGGLNLNDQNISMNGDGTLVLNVLGSFSLTGTASILGNAQNVFINYLGTSTMVTTGLPSIEGQVFIPNAAADLEGTVNGAVYSGDGTISFLSTSTLNGNPVPEPATIVLAAMSGLSTILLRHRFGRLKKLS